MQVENFHKEILYTLECFKKTIAVATGITRCTAKKL